MSPAEQHLATRSAAGIFDFSFMGLFEFLDEASLQALQSRTLTHLVPGQIVYSLILDGDGSVFNDATVWQMGGERYWLWTGRRSDYQRFRSMARDRSGEFDVLALQGPASGAILASLFGREMVAALGYFRFVQRNTLLIARLGYSGELGYELIVPAAERHGLWQLLAKAGAAECGPDAMNSLRIEAGYVLFDREIDGRANPRELGLERLVSTKTDFSFKKKLVGFEIETVSVKKDLPEGVLTSESYSPTLRKHLGLGFVPPDASGEVRLADSRSARIVPLPFYDPERRRPRGAPL